MDRAAKLRELRAKLNLTSRQAAARLAVDMVHYFRLEAGEDRLWDSWEAELTEDPDGPET